MEHQPIIAAPAADAVPTILIARATLLEALATIKSVVERKNTIPILAGVLFAPLSDTGDGLALIGTDLDIRAEVHVPAIFTDGCRFVAASCAALHDAVKACKADDMTLELSGGKLRLSGGGYSTALPTLPADDFPDMVADEMEAELMLPGRDLAYDLARVSPAISTEESRYYLNGIFVHAACDQPAAPSEAEEALRAARDDVRGKLAAHDRASVAGDDEGMLDPDHAEAFRQVLENAETELKRMAAERCKPDVLKLKATDGHRLSVVTKPLPEGAETLPDVIIPRKVVAVISRLVGKPVAEPKSIAGAVHAGRTGKFNPDVHFAFSHTKVRARIGRTLILAKLVDGTFPDVDRVIPSQNDRILTLTGDEMASAAKVATAHCEEKTRSVRLDIGASETVFSASSPETGVGRAVVATQFRTLAGDTAPDMEIGFNAAYLATMGTIFGNVAVDVHLADAAAPTLFTSPAIPGFKAVLMPMRVDGSCSDTAAPAAPFKPAEAPFDRLQRVYTAAYAAGDMAGVKRAVEDYRAACPDASRDELAFECATIRARVATRPADAGIHLAAQRRAEGRCHAAHVAASGFVTQHIRGGGARSPGSFGKLLEIEKSALLLASLPGYDPADPRNILPVETSVQGLVYVAAHELRNIGLPVMTRLDAKGIPTRKRSASNLVWRTNIVAVAPAKMAAGDMAMALLRSETERREMAARMARLESMVADLVASRDELTEPVGPPTLAERVGRLEYLVEADALAEPTPAPEPSVLGTVIAGLAERAEAAEAAAERATRARPGLIGLIGRLRARCAAAVKRADHAEAERDRAMELARTSDIALAAMAARAGRAEAELDKLQPLVAAIRAVAA